MSRKKRTEGLNRSRRKVEWVRLDNASKIFPATANHKDTKVFRMFCELEEPVEPLILQEALDRTIVSFPLYRTVLRRGVFWYYFENTEIRPEVHEDDKQLYSPLYIKGERMLPFRVTYFHQRIFLEVFHALSDGTGAFWFLQTLVWNYLLLRYPDAYPDGPPDLGVAGSLAQRMDDSFGRHFRYRTASSEERRVPSAAEAGGTADTPSVRDNHGRLAYKIPGRPHDFGQQSVIEGEISARAALDLAHEYDSTLSIFLVAVFFQSIYADMPYKKKPRPIRVAVPVNLRQFYASETARNFFSLIEVSHLREDPVKVPELAELIPHVRDSFASELTDEKLVRRVSRLMRLERLLLVRLVPTSVKDVLLKISHWVSDLGGTASMSNMGRIKMPREMLPMIHSFGVSTSVRRPQICACSMGDRLIVSFSSPLKENEVARRFFEFFTSRGVSVRISSNIGVLPAKPVEADGEVSNLV